MLCHPIPFAFLVNPLRLIAEPYPNSLMPIETVPNTNLQYFLIAHDASGVERTDDPDGGILSSRVEEVIAEQGVTDVFLMSHGWKGDLPAAREQCNQWISAMLGCGADIAQARMRFPAFRPLIVGYHWPSLPWGDEGLNAAGMSFDLSAVPSREQLIADAAARIAGSADARDALGNLLDYAAHNPSPAALPAEVSDWYRVLDRESGLGSGGAEPWNDRGAFDPDASFQRGMEEERSSFGRVKLGGILGPLRQLSFWTMKARAQRVGEGGGAALLSRLRSAAQSSPLRIHLMGHSFGCIVVCGMVRGVAAAAPGPSVHSMLLAQGALSLWSFSSSIPVAPGERGYFSPVVNAVSGPILTTASVHDTAVGRLYPLAAGVARQVAFAIGEFPKYGALGSFGARGIQANDLKMRSTDHEYDFQPGRVYNLESSEIIRDGGGFSGAHGDIARVEVAHAFWAAALTEASPADHQPVSFSTPGFTPPLTHSSAIPAAAMTDDLLVLNGVDGSTGNYLVPPIPVSDIAAFITKPAVRGSIVNSPEAEALKSLATAMTQAHLGLPWDSDPTRISSVGWALVFHENEDPAVKAALLPLQKHRQTQAPGRVKELTFRVGHDWRSWLADHHVAAGTVDPDLVPYYLLIVGDPELIPFEFCHQLDLEYAVGRLHFDSVEDYARYAQGVIDYETSASVPNGKEVVFFGPRHDFDAATQLSADLLIDPLADGKPAANGQPAAPSPAQKAGFRTRKMSGAAATKAALKAVLAADGGSTPAVLFTASHGLGWPRGDERQRAATGALLCQDWPGLGEVSPEQYLAASDIDDARPAGMITIHFACFGAGTPAEDRFFHVPGQEPPRIAEKAFIALLPQRLLAHPSGGALACVGHVERAWGYSIRPRAAGPQLLPFQNLLARLFHGQPLGHAMKDLNERYAVLATQLSSKLEKVGYGRKYPDSDLVADWIERNDAEGYLVLGDPAVSLRVQELA